MPSKLNRKCGARSDEGYTLTEMLIVIVIIGLLAAAITPGIIGQLARARARTAQLQIETVAAAIETYRSDVGRYPTSSEGLRALVSSPSPEANWLGPYVRSAEALADPWGRQLIYESPDNGSSFSILTYGADGQQGGDAANRDIRTSTAP